MLNGQLSPIAHTDRFNILCRANSFLNSHNLSLISEKAQQFCAKTDIFASFFEVAPISISHLDRLYFHTIYSDGPFSLVDYLMENSVPEEWIESKLSFVSDQIETNCKELIATRKCEEIEREFLVNWIKKQPVEKPVDSDLLSLRILESLILSAIAHFQRVPEAREQAAFKILEERLIDWSEAAGLIRSLSDTPLSLAADSSMDIDFNPNSETSTLFALKPNEFDIYLLQKFKGMATRKYKEIVEIVADRCGIPVDSDFEETPKKPDQQQKQLLKEPVKHWRRVKPVTLPIKHVASSKVNRPSSLSVTELKSTRFLSSTSSSSTRQVDLALKPQPIAESNSFDRGRRRHSEASAPQILQQTTPTKSKKSFNLAPSTENSSALADSFIILETPPRVLTKTTRPENDLSGSARRLFSSQPMEE